MLKTEKIKTESTSKVAEVRRTNDYSMFSQLVGNRELNAIHLKSLELSMSNRLLFSPILVNEKYEIIDGQHRFNILQGLRQPVDFIVIKGYGLKEVHILNTFQKNWNADDYMNGYIELGNEDYVLYKQFKNEFKFGHNESMAMLSNKPTFRGDLLDSFKRGEFKIENYEEAVKSAERINMLSKYYAGYKRKAFVMAMLTCFHNTEYNHSLFLSKIEFQSTKLVDCTDRKSYLTLIEDIYNYKIVKNRINLRFRKTKSSIS